MRILLVEDEQRLNKYICKNLKGEGFRVDTCFDGLEARNFIESNYESLDLVILDLMLPSLDGLEVMKSIREEGITTPILILTARDQLEDRVVGLNSGADDYLAKPFSIDELVARVRVLMRRPNMFQPEKISIKNLSLDTRKRELTIDTNKIDLTAKEFQILEYLIKYRGQILEREMILDKIWGNDYDSFSNTVDVHIKNLRRKLKGYGEFIETVRGLGYRFSD